jgi:hypothetical protein
MLREGHRQIVFVENMVLMRILRPKREEVTVG